MAKQLKDLPNDIFELFNPDKDHEVSEENLDQLCNDLKETLRTRLKARDKSSEGNLRFSSMGRPDRQIWYAAQDDIEPEPMLPKTYFKFLYGDVIEQLILFLARESGHTVERAQEEIEVNGVKGHIDAIIDGTVVDVKSASSFGFKKFKENRVLEDDPFGYVQQLAGYSSVLNPGEPAAWLVFDKVSGDICVTNLSSSVINSYNPENRIQHLKDVVSSDQPPPRCYEDVADGKSGNKKLSVGCSYCAYKHHCWPGIRTFLYSTGPRFLTEVKNTPNVPEVNTHGD